MNFKNYLRQALKEAITQRPAPTNLGPEEPEDFWGFGGRDITASGQPSGSGMPWGPDWLMDFLEQLFGSDWYAIIARNFDPDFNWAQYGFVDNQDGSWTLQDPYGNAHSYTMIWNNGDGMAGNCADGCWVFSWS